MSNQITFKSDADVRGFGRNGAFKATAVTAFPTWGGEVHICNVTSKGEQARGYVGLPLDPEAIRALAYRLLEIADDEEHERSKA